MSLEGANGLNILQIEREIIVDINETFSPPEYHTYRRDWDIEGIQENYNESWPALKSLQNS